MDMTTCHERNWVGQFIVVQILCCGRSYPRVGVAESRRGISSDVIEAKFLMQVADLVMGWDVKPEHWAK